MNEPANATVFAAGADNINRIPPETGLGRSGLTVAAQAESQSNTLMIENNRIIVTIGLSVPKVAG